MITDVQTEELLQEVAARTAAAATAAATQTAPLVVKTCRRTRRQRAT